MKALVLMLAVLGSVGSAFAEQGDLYFRVDGVSPNSFGQVEVQDAGDRLSGISGSEVYLDKQSGGYQGFAYGRPTNITCTATACTDSATQANLTLTKTADGYKLAGSYNFVYVEATVTASAINVLADTSFELTNTDGTYSGNGVDFAGNPFTMELTATGTLAPTADPAAFIALVINPFVRR